MNTSSRTYLFYHRQTGAILGTSSATDADQRPRAQSEEELRSLIPGLRGAPSPGDVAILELADHRPGTRLGGHLVDVHHKKLVARHQLRVEPAKSVLHGDGKDATELAITVLDEHGKPASGFDGELHVTTSRGKLSERGGRVKAAHGKATLTLTSVPETVHKVSVTVTDPSGRSVRGAATLAFE